MRYILYLILFFGILYCTNNALESHKNIKEIEKKYEKSNDNYDDSVESMATLVGEVFKSGAICGFMYYHNLKDQISFETEHAEKAGQYCRTFYKTFRREMIENES